jgi:hypothetical protein
VVEIPENKATMEDVAEWYKLTEELAKLKSKEALLRPRIYRTFFANPVEGTNTFVLPDQYCLKAVRKIDRKVDEPVMFAFRAPEVVDGVPTNQSKFEKLGVKADELFKPKYELVTSEYRKYQKAAATGDEKAIEALKLIDQVLIIKDGMPQLDIAPPSTRAAKK